MKRFNHKISIVLLLVFFSLFLVDNTSAQKRSYENKNLKDIIPTHIIKAHH